MVVAHTDPFDEMMEQMSQNQALEQGLVRIAQPGNNSCDPLVRQMAEEVLKEVHKARQRRRDTNTVVFVSFAIMSLIGFILFLVFYFR